jgi:hypothetical protein
MLNLKTWEPVTYYLDEEREAPITFKVKRLQFIEAEPLKLILASAMAAMEPTLAKQQAAEEAGEAARNAARASGADEDSIQRAGQAAMQAESAKHDPQEALAAMRETYKAVPKDDVARAFSEYIRDVEGLAVDGVKVTTGDQLHAIADEQLVFFVLGSLRRFAKLSVTEGKASSSSRISTSAGTASSSSPATSTSAEDGPAPSDAAVEMEPASSIAGA